jgi:hypothetical protein
MRRIRIKASRPRIDPLADLDLRTPSGRLLSY